jgi:hypothetical protein
VEGGGLSWHKKKRPASLWRGERCLVAAPCKLAFTVFAPPPRRPPRPHPPRVVQQALFPDNAYRHDSGGDPAVIPDLTFEQFQVRARSGAVLARASGPLARAMPACAHPS